MDSGAETGESTSESSESPDLLEEAAASGKPVASSELDALDATPSAIRRGRLVVGIMLALAVAAIVILIVMPPLSWKPPKSVKQNFESLSVAEAVQTGGGERISLAYQPVSDVLRYRVTISQSSVYAGGKPVNGVISADVELFVPSRSDLADTVGIRLESVESHVKDGDGDVTLESAGGMLMGVSLYTRLDPHHGMGRAVPDSNVNPQVARVLYILTDGLRDIWLPLPEEAVGVGGGWRVSSVGTQNLDVERRAETRVISVADGVSLETSYEFVRGGGKVGGGKSSVLLRDGVVERGTVELKRDSALLDGGAQSQSVRLDIEIIRGGQQS